MPTARCEIITHSRPNDPPKDYATNTVYFDAAGQTIGDADYQALSDALSNIWKRSIQDGGWSGMDQRGHQIKVYSMSDPKPRPIRGTTTFTPSFPKTDALYPREVALCLSYYSDRNLPRNRGRIYIGPFDQSAFTMSERPPDNLMTKLIGLGNLLFGLTSIGTVNWVHAVWSTRDNLPKPVNHYWVNDEWDTVRRRGFKETKRFKADH